MYIVDAMNEKISRAVFFLNGVWVVDGEGGTRYSPVIGGGSTTVAGPKNVGISPEVVTGVLRSPC